MTDKSTASLSSNSQKDTARIVWRQIPTNEHCREYEFRVPIVGYCIWHRHSGYSFEERTPPAVATLLTEINGVESFLLRDSYCFMISKGAAFDWNELHYQILTALEAHNAQGGTL